MELEQVPGFLMVAIVFVDLLVVLDLLTPAIYSTAVGEIVWHKTVLCSFQAFSQMYLQNYKSFLIMLCALDRALSIVFPFSYTRLMSRNVLYAALGVGLAESSLFIAYSVVSSGVIAFADVMSGMCWLGSDDDEMYGVKSMIANMLAPGVVVVVCYTSIIVVVVQQRSEIRSQKTLKRDNHDSGVKNLLAHLAACKMLFLVTLLYFLSFLPVIIVDSVSALNNLYTYKLSTYLTYLNTTTNFAIYYKLNKAFKRSAHSNLPCLSKLETDIPYSTNC